MQGSGVEVGRGYRGFTITPQSCTVGRLIEAETKHGISVEISVGIGERMFMYTIVKMENVRRELGAHYDRRDAATYVAYCSCGEMLRQDMDTCPSCKSPVIWHGSKTWQDLFGSPAAAERRLASQPTDDLGVELCELAGLHSFPTPYHLARWKKALKVLGRARVEKAVRRCHASIAARGSSTRGLVEYVLNSVDKEIRQQSPDPESATATEVTEVTVR